MINKMDFLDKVSIFSHMKKTDIHRIAELAQHHLFRNGDLIIRECVLQHQRSGLP